MVCIDKSRTGTTTWRMLADERFANPVGTVQGGFLAAFADSAMGASSVTWAKDRKVFSANAELKISFFRPARVGSMLTCTAQVVAGGNLAAFVEAEVVDDEGKKVARASSTYLLTPRSCRGAPGSPCLPALRSRPHRSSPWLFLERRRRRTRRRPGCRLRSFR